MKSTIALGLLLALVALAGCQRQEPDAAYLQGVTKAAELLDGYGGKRDDLVETAALLSKAMADQPDLPHAYVESARLVMKGGHISSGRFVGDTLARARAMLDEAERLDPDYCETYSLRGHVLTLTKEFDAALAALDRADALECPNPWRFANRGDLLIKMNRLSEAAVVYGKLAERGPGTTTRDHNVYTAALGDLTSLALARGDFDAARDFIHKELDVARPNHAWDYSEAAHKLVFTGDFDESIAAAQRALEIMEFGVGRATLATAQYGKSIEIQARLRQSEELGEAERQTLQAEADALWEKAAAVFPDFREVAGRLWQSAANRDLGFRTVLTERATPAQEQPPERDAAEPG